MNSDHSTVESVPALTFDQAATIHSRGRPETWLARIAARRAFVEMKQLFMRAAVRIPGRIGEQLRRDVRQATEVAQLWRLHSPVLSALPAEDTETAGHFDEMRRHFDGAFQNTEGGLPCADSS